MLAAFSVRIWLEYDKICKNKDHICLFHCINICQVPLEMFEHSAIGPVFKQLPQYPENVNARKTCAIPIFLSVTGVGRANYVTLLPIKSDVNISPPILSVPDHVIVQCFVSRNRKLGFIGKQN